jgi:hypothetical protein
MAKHRRRFKAHRRHYGDGPSGLTFGRVVGAVVLGEIVFGFVQAFLPVTPQALMPMQGLRRIGPNFEGRR